MAVSLVVNCGNTDFSAEEGVTEPIELLLIRHQAITWTNVDLLFIRYLGKKFQ